MGQRAVRDWTAERLAVCGVDPSALDFVCDLRGAGFRIGDWPQIRRSKDFLRAVHGIDRAGGDFSSFYGTICECHSVMVAGLERIPAASGYDLRSDSGEPTRSDGRPDQSQRV